MDEPLIILTPLAGGIWLLASKLGLWRLPAHHQRLDHAPTATATLVLLLFVLFFAFHLLLFPTLFIVGAHFFSDRVVYTALFATCTSLFAAFFFLLLVKKFEPHCLPELFPKNRAGLHLLYGVLLWAVVYPFLLIGARLGELILLFFFPGEPVGEQLALTQLKAVLHHPFSFALFSVNLVILVPFIEEMLFRGFLQGVLQRRLPIPQALFLTALLFALLHLSAQQQLANIPLFIVLFSLAGFLSWARLRFSLWSAIGLHLAFNFFSICLVFLSR